MHNKIIKSNAIKRIATTLGLSFGVLYLTGYLEDAYYMIGGLQRGLRCIKTGIKIANKYIYVINIINMYIRRE